MSATRRDDQVLYADDGGGDDPSQNVPGIFPRRKSSVTQISVWNPATSDWYDMNSLDARSDERVKTIKEINNFQETISTKWRGGYHEEVIEESTKSLDDLCRKRPVLGDTVVFLRFQRWLYKYLSRSLWAITSATFQRLSQKICFHFEDHLLESWRCHRRSILIAHEFDILLMCGEDCQWQVVDGTEWTHDARYQRDCLSFANASLALIGYISQKSNSTENTDEELKNGFAKAIVKHLKEAFRCRELIKNQIPKCTWDMYLVHRVYLLACLRGREDVQNEIASHFGHQISGQCLDEAHNDLSSLEQFLNSVAIEVAGAKIPKILLNVEDGLHRKPTMKTTVIQPPCLWWLKDSSEPDVSPEPDVPPSPRDEQAFSVGDDLNSTGPFGQDNEEWIDIRCYKNRIFSVYGQISHRQMMSSENFKDCKRSFQGNLLAGSLSCGRPYHARNFQYELIDDMWYYKNTIFEITGELAVQTPGKYRTVYSINILQYGKRVAKKYKDGGRHAMKFYVGAVRNQAIARYYAQSFNGNLREADRYRVRVLRADVLHVFEDCARQQIIGLFTMEEEGPYEFFKFGSERPASNDPQREIYDYCMSFAHHAYKESEGRLVIADLQGFVREEDGEIVLTDAAIHAPNVTLLSTESMNQGQRGIESFFRLHSCNNFCIQMQLHKYRPNSTSRSAAN